MESSISKNGNGIPNTFWTICSSLMTCLSASSLQVLSSLMNSLTVQLGLGKGVECRDKRSTRLQLSTQLSNQNLILAPFPTRHLMLFLRRDRLRKIDFQTGESDGLEEQSRREEALRYFCLIKSTQRLLVSCRSRQASLHWKATLTASIFRSPNTLGSLRSTDSVPSDHWGTFIHWRMFPKKSRLTLSKARAVDFGSSKHCMI